MNAPIPPSNNQKNSPMTFFCKRVQSTLKKFRISIPKKGLE